MTRRTIIGIEPNDDRLPRRQMLQASAAALGGIAMTAASNTNDDAKGSGKVFRIGVISATIRGKPQPRNGHTWHFAQYLHPTIDLDVYCQLVDPGSADFFRKYVRNPKFTFDQLPFPDTRITQYYDADPHVAAKFTEAFPDVVVARSVEAMVAQVDAVWLGDASGFGDDHFDLVAPDLRQGLPTFCDKPIGETPAGTRKILEFAKQHNAPIMSSSRYVSRHGQDPPRADPAPGNPGSHGHRPRRREITTRTKPTSTAGGGDVITDSGFGSWYERSSASIVHVRELAQTGDEHCDSTST